MEEKEKKWELLKGSRLILLISQNKRDILHTVLVWGFYCQSPFTNYQKLQIQTLLQGESRKKTKKRTKSESQTGSRNSDGNLNSAQGEGSFATL